MRNFALKLLAIAITAGCTKTNEKKPAEQKEKIIEISTSFGKMYVWLYKQTPLHRNNFLALADTGYFNNTTFHRIVPNFVIQGGDPNSKDDETIVAQPKNINDKPITSIPMQIKVIKKSLQEIQNTFNFTPPL